ncbi:SigE family RNA polymerase sigma factor [Trebonia kvetii]|uniref:SigE family RNA polymerase sigma factor n=1 Tax=Trebonia kvetii TaxID=2480626 RepID=A0A6P2BTB5_9ACTN|nr:SigE family RNA polymerase sigma factor [Trebonia kvetii]
MAGQAVDHLLGGADTARLPAVVGFLSAPIDDAIGEQDEGTIDESSVGGCPNGEPGDAAAPSGLSASSGTVANSAVAANGASIVTGAVYLGAAVPADTVAAVPVDTVTVPALDDVAVAPEKDDGNLSVAGEPSDAVTRRTDVTETLAANALLPEVVLAPEAFTAQARSASAVWDAAEVVTEIYNGHYNQLVRLAVLLVHDVQTAEEVVQDAFEAMHLAWRRLRDSEKALSYLRQTVVNRSRSVLRHRKVVDMHAPKPAPDEPSAEHAAMALLERSAVAEALRSLPLRQREAIVLRYYADFSEADIAAAMGISRGAVKSHTARAMAALKSILERETS